MQPKSTADCPPGEKRKRPGEQLYRRAFGRESCGSEGFQGKEQESTEKMLSQQLLMFSSKPIPFPAFPKSLNKNVYYADQIHPKNLKIT